MDRWPGPWLMLVAVSASSVTTVAEQAIVFGPDDPRQALQSSSYPFNAVGRLRLSDSNWCTASLISDRHILTAAHCFVAERNRDLQATGLVDLQSVVFEPNIGAARSGSHRSPGVHVARIVDHGSFDLHPRSHDWAIAELAEPVDPVQSSAMSIAPPELLHSLEDSSAALGAGRLSHIGYPAQPEGADGTPALVEGCSDRRYISQTVVDGASRNIQDLWLDRVTMFVHDCSASGGHSGGPIFLWHRGTALIVGIHTMEDVPKEYVSLPADEAIRMHAFDFLYVNYAVSVEQFGPAARRLIVPTAVGGQSWGSLKRRHGDIEYEWPATLW